MKQFVSFVSNLKQYLFYLTLLLLPTQLGRHFWPSFSFVQGLRVDYLSPTVYITDILIFALFAIWISFAIYSLYENSNLKAQISKPKLKSQSFLILIFLLILLINIYFSKIPPLGLYGLLKMAEFVFFSFYVAKNVTKNNFQIVLFLFAFGVLLESGLSILQFLKQSSIGGVFYFLGERAFNSQTPGIANASLNGELLLRPYGTFSHPNVLAGYLLIAITMIISKIKKIFFLGVLIIGSIALFLTMSRAVILLWFLIVILSLLASLRSGFQYLSLTSLRAKRGNPFQGLLRPTFMKLNVVLAMTIVLIFSIIILFSPIANRFSSDSLTGESFLFRKEQTMQAFLMIKDHPVFGVGLNNYLLNLSNYPSFINNPFQRLQPVHNIYLLVLAETGIIGFSCFILFLIKTLKRIRNHELGVRILFIVLVLGMLDHYFLTLQQGQLLLSFVLGLCFALHLRGGRGFSTKHGW